MDRVEKQAATRLRLRVDYGSSVVLSHWSSEYQRGHRAEALPYGLQRLGDAVQLEALGRTNCRLSDLLIRSVRRLTDIDFVAARLGRPRPDVVLCWEELTGFGALLTARAPVVLGVIWLGETSLIRRWVARRMLRRARAVWVLSRAQIPTLAMEFRVSPERLHYVRFGVDPQFWTPDLDGEPSGGSLLSVGNDRHRDDLTLAAAYRLLRASREVSLRVITMREADQRLAGLPGVSVGAANHAELRDAYRSTAVVILALRPNDHASGVTALLEAMSCGCAVVVTGDGLEDYIQDGAAIVLPGGDAAGIAREVAALLDEPVRARQIGARARASVVSHYSSERMVEELGDLILHVGRP